MVTLFQNEEARWDCDLDEEVFFRPVSEIPGGEELLRRHEWRMEYFP